MWVGYEKFVLANKIRIYSKFKSLRKFYRRNINIIQCTYTYSVYGICLNNMFILLPIGLNSANSGRNSVEEAPFMKRLKR